MINRIHYAPTQKVNIGVEKDTLNDFARKYNLEIEGIYDILNKYALKKVVFYADSDYWVQTGDNQYKISLPHNDNVVFAVYKTISSTESEQELIGVSIVGDNVEFEASAPFDGYMLYSTINGDVGIGYNAPDDIVAIMNAIKEETDQAKLDAIDAQTAAETAAQNASLSAGTAARDAAEEVAETMAPTLADSVKQEIFDYVNAALDGAGDGVFQYDSYLNLMPTAEPVGSDRWDVDGNGDIMPKEDLVSEVDPNAGN